MRKKKKNAYNFLFSIGGFSFLLSEHGKECSKDKSGQL